MLKNHLLPQCAFAFVLASAGILSAAEDAASKRIRVPDGFVVELAAGSEQIAYGMCATLDDRGRLFVTESSGRNIPGEERVTVRECRIRLLEDKNGDGFFESSKVFADKLSFPMGVAYHQGSLFVASPPEFLRLDDTDDDGVSDKRTILLQGWNVKNSASLHGPFLGPDGFLYLTHGRHGYKITTREGKTIQGLASRIYRCNPDGTQLERIAGGGFDNPVELAFTPGGEIFCTMTYIVNPKEGLSPAGMRDALIHIVQGAVFPKMHDCVKEFTYTGELMPPMIRMARVAPAGLMRYRGQAFGPEYEGLYFSAQFNPHQVRRHVITPRGATYVATDEEFLISGDPDFHPTDVLEDADGSLLVVDTGGWYLQACPLSRIARPEIKGGIWRVRRKDAPKIKDPRGLALRSAKLSLEQRVSLLDDPRFVVRDWAVEALVSRGPSAVKSLQILYSKSKSARARRNAIWCLARIGGPEACKTVRAALADPDVDVRMAAARCAGLGRDTQAVAPLKKILLGDESLHVRRQAATAIGQIGDAKAVPALIEALTADPGRFLEHAIIYALFHTAGPDELCRALDHEHPLVKKAALLGLEQFHPARLERAKVAPLLQTDHEALRQAVLWVLGRHPDWSGDIVDYLAKWLAAPELAPERFSAMRNALVAFSENKDIQAFVARSLVSKEVPADRRGLLLEVIALYPGAKLPASWADRLQAALGHPDPEIRSQAVATIRTRSLDAFDAQLVALATDTSQPKALRLASLAAAVSRLPSLDAPLFALLTANLDPDTETLLRISAAESLARAPLTDRQRMRLVDTLTHADALIFATLVNTFAKGRETALGEALVRALLDNAENAERLPKEQLDKLLASYPQSVRLAAKPLYERLAEADRTKAETFNRLLPLINGGNVRRGRAIFFSSTASCGSCHRVGEEGGRIGPDLTKVGGIRAGRDLLESVIFPSSSFARGYETYLIQTEDGAVYNGVITRQTADTVTIRNAQNTDIRVEREAIEQMKRSAVSIMPAGLDKALTPQQLRDLLAFLQSLK